MSVEPTLVIALPFAASAVLVALLDRFPQRVTQWTAIVLGVVTLAGTASVLADVMRHGARVVWIGGWHPGNRVGLGIVLGIDLASACVAVLVAMTVSAAIVFSFEYFEEVGTIFYVLILAMLGGMIAFAYAADLFNLFVWYEVFSVAAYALAAYRTESQSAYKGALQFALTNSVAGLFFLVGISLLEGRTGELGFVAVGHSLAAHGRADVLVTTSLAFIAIGLFTRGALVPLHFWFDEVHAAAPAPLCAILSGAMSPLALYGFVRIYWTVYSRVLPPSHLLVVMTIGIGVLSALYGVAMTLRESRLKRKLAYATIAHSGVALAAIGEFTPRALAGAATYEAGYAAAAGALFFGIAILRTYADEYDAKRLRGAGRRLPFTSAAFALATLTLAALWSSARATASAAGPAHSAVVGALAGLVGAATGGAFGAVYARTFLTRPLSSFPRQQRPPWFLIAPALGLALLSVAIGSLGSALDLAMRAATFLTDPRAYGSAVMLGVRELVPATAVPQAGLSSWLAPIGALAVALLVLTPNAGVRRLRIRLQRSSFSKAIGALDSGDSGLYIAWISGIAAILAAAYSFMALP